MYTVYTDSPDINVMLLKLVELWCCEGVELWCCEGVELWCCEGVDKLPLGSLWVLCKCWW